MLPCERSCQHQIAVESRISGEHAPISSDEPRKIFSWLNRAMMKNIRLADYQARKQLLKRRGLRRNRIEKRTVITFIHSVNSRLGISANANNVLPGVL